MDVTTADLRTSVAQQTRFALRLATTLSSAAHPAGGARSNMVFCPLTLQMALSLVAAGMAGATRDQLVSLLGVPRGTAEGLHAFAEQVVQLVLADASSTGGPHVAFANSVLVDSSLSLKQSFKDVAMGKYKAETHSVDFQTKAAEVAGQVNAWVDRVTSGLIKEIIPPESIGHTTRLVLGNALYFKGAWAEKFDVSETKDGEFHLLDGESVQAPFMSTRKMQYLSSYGSFKVLKLPYLQGGDKRPFSMYILLPEAQDGLWSLAEKLNSELEFLENHIPMRQVHVGQFMLPKFKISFGFEATGLLKGLGLHLLFSSEVDLIEMVDSPGGQNLFVSSIFHKSFIEVNEEGTESAAAVTATFKKKSKPRRVNFIADHPFLFLIREDITGVVLFIGHVVNPFLLHRVFVCRTL